MTQGKILHLAHDDKFLDYAYESFERIMPGKNDYLVLPMHGKIKYVVNAPYEIFHISKLFNPMFYKSMVDYDAVIIHSLQPVWVSLINKAPKNIVFVWVGWGYDYYDLVTNNTDELCLDKTRKISKLLENDGTNVRGSSFSLVKRVLAKFLSPIKRFLYSQNKNAAISKISFFSPVLESEYHLIKEKLKMNIFPEYFSWNYGSLEGVLLKGFIGREINGNNILVGNSASLTNNHVEVFDFLEGSLSLIESRKIIVPLSYGDKGYANKMVDIGVKKIGNNFHPLIEFMPMSSYVELVSSCSHVIMNHIRQQSVGNIIIMMYLGAVVFIRKESPVYTFFKSKNAYIYSIQELEKDKSLLTIKLTKEQIEDNRSILHSYWSEEITNEKTANLIKACQKRRQLLRGVL